MAPLIGGALDLLAVAFLFCLAVAFGERILALLGPLPEDPLEEALYAAGLFFAIFSMVLFALGWCGWMNRATALALIGVAALGAGKHWRRLSELWRRAAEFIGNARTIWWLKATLNLAAAALLADALLALAPLTGSDAMHYHFTVPLLEFRHRVPNVSLASIAHAAFTGQGHALIEFGLAVGSDRLSMLLLWLGGVLAAGSLLALARRLTSERWAWLAVLSFLAAPMIWWQIGVAGAPDIWMAFYTTMAVLALARAGERGATSWFMAAGVLAGAAAGVKYIGWAVPLSILALTLWKSRLRTAAVTTLGCLAAGILPLARNLSWTGDPFSPFLARWLAPAHFNSYAYAAILADARAADFHRGFLSALAYPFLMTVRGWPLGWGGLFGPLVLASLPLLLVWRPRKGFLIPAAGVTWATLLISNALSSQMARFLLPAFPLALGLGLAAMSEASAKRWRVASGGCCATVLLFIAFGFVCEASYARSFLPAAVGAECRDAFLERAAPDYPIAKFVNESLARRPGNVMVFFRHLYYLRVPFVNGDPASSWPVDPGRLSRPDALLEFLQELGVRWVVKAPDYPMALAESFHALETEGHLRPFASTTVDRFVRFRFQGSEVPTKVVILEVLR